MTKICLSDETLVALPDNFFNDLLYRIEHAQDLNSLQLIYNTDGRSQMSAEQHARLDKVMAEAEARFKVRIRA